MQHIRLIQSIKWHQKEDKLLLFLWGKKITIPNNLGLAELFCEMQSWQQEYTREFLVDKFQFSEKLVELLIQLWVFITLNNCAGPEARDCHSLVENPSCAYYSSGFLPMYFWKTIPQYIREQPKLRDCILNEDMHPLG